MRLLNRNTINFYTLCFASSMYGMSACVNTQILKFGDAFSFVDSELFKLSSFVFVKLFPQLRVPFFMGYLSSFIPHTLALFTDFYANQMAINALLMGGLSTLADKWLMPKLDEELRLPTWLTTGCAMVATSTVNGLLFSQFAKIGLNEASLDAVKLTLIGFFAVPAINRSFERVAQGDQNHAL